MPSTKIPTPSSVRRALTTLKRYGAIKSIEQTPSDIECFTHTLTLNVDSGLLSAKKTSRKKPKHKKVLVDHSLESNRLQ